MKKHISSVLILFLLSTPIAFGSPIKCGTAALDSLFKSIEIKDRGPFTDYKATNKTEKPVVGTVLEIWSWDLSVQPPANIQVKSLCVAVTDHAYIFVEEAVIEEHFGPQVTSAVVKAFESACPAYPDRGVLDLEFDVFGSPPDALDNDEKIYIFYSHIASYGSMGFDGYFNAFNQMPDSVAWEKYRQHSNEVEMLYMNATGSKTADSEYMLSVLAHELQHLIHYNYDTEEESWVNEAMSEAAMTLCGYYTDVAHLGRYCSKPSTPLIKPYISYGAVLLFGTYLYEQYGTSFLTDIVECKETGIASIEAVLGQYADLDFSGLFHQWGLANLCASHLSFDDGIYGYSSFPLPALALSAEYTAATTSLELSLKSSGFAYMKLSGNDEKLTLTIDNVELLNSSTKTADALSPKATLPTVFFIDGNGQNATELSDTFGSYDIPAARGFLMLTTIDCGSLKFRALISD